MPKVKLTITDSKCRCGYFTRGQEFLVEDLCPPLCHELWNSICAMLRIRRNVVQKIQLSLRGDVGIAPYDTSLHA